MVTAAIKTSQALIDLQNEIAREELQQAAKTESDDLFQKLVEADPNLAGLLTNKDPVIVLPSKGAGDNGDDAGSKQFEGKYSPTFLKFEGKTRETGIMGVSLFFLAIKKERGLARINCLDPSWLTCGSSAAG